MTLKFADLVSATNPRAGKSPDVDGPRRTDRLAKPASGMATATMPGAPGRKAGRSGNTSRFAHWAAAEQAADTASAPAAGVPFRDIPAGHGVRQAAIRAEIARASRPASGEAEGKKAADQTLATAKRLGIIK